MAVTFNNLESRGSIRAKINMALSRRHYPEDYGAVGGGVTDDTEAIRATFLAAGNNGTIIFTPGKTYLITNRIFIYPGQTVIGYGAKIKRAANQFTALSVDALVGATTITVNDASFFSVDDFFIVLDTTSEYGGAGHKEANGSSITAINGNVLTIDGTLALPDNGNLNSAGKYPSGATVVKVYPMFERSGGSTQDKPNTILGLEIDGNKAENNLTFWWAVNFGMAFLRRGSVYRDMIFRNMPCECLNLSSSCYVDGCQFFDLDGSAIHIGQVTEDPVGDVGSNRIVNNIFRRVCLLGTRNGSHSEGAITVSVQVKKTFIAGNLLETCGTAFYASIGTSSSQPDAEAFLYNNRVYDTVGIVRSAGNTGAVNNNLQIVGNTFENCRWLWVSREQLGGTKVEKGWGGNRIQITNNIFVNAKININDATNVTIAHNELEVENGFSFENDFALVVGTETNYKALIQLSSCAEFSVTNNFLINRNTTEDSRLDNGIVASVEITPVLIKTDVSTTTEYAYFNRHSKINHNTVINFKRGILDMTPTVSSGRQAYDHIRSFSYIGMEIKNNTVQISAVPTPDVTKYYGILCSPGTKCLSNKVYGPANATCGIYVIGVNDGLGTAYSGTARIRLNGPIVEKNEVLGLDVSIIVGNVGGTTIGHNTYNARVIDNEVDGTVTDRTSGNSTISGTVTLINDALPIYLLRQNPEFY